MDFPSSTADALFIILPHHSLPSLCVSAVEEIFPHFPSCLCALLFFVFCRAGGFFLLRRLSNKQIMKQSQQQQSENCINCCELLFRFLLPFIRRRGLKQFPRKFSVLEELDGKGKKGRKEEDGVSQEIR
jgi:hypothetical protein